MNNKDKQFPKDFLWGVASSAYQTEGNNENSDWWGWEQKGKTKDKSGVACGYWNQWKSDHALLTDLGVNSFRLSLEWARIEPKEGEFSEEAIQHYREILQDLKNRNIKTQVTFWHWTSPIWFQKKYGFHKKKSVVIFTRYIEKVVEELENLIDIFVVLNEPMVPLGQGFLAGVFPPGFKNPCKFIRAVSHLSKAYKKSYKIIHKFKPEALVGITYLYNWYESDGLEFLLGILNRIMQWYRINLFANKIKGFQDYIGIDYYRLGKVRFNRHNIKLDSINQSYFGFTAEEDKNNVMKWITYPEGIHKVLKKVWQKHKLPIYIMENGFPSAKSLDDSYRISFIRDHLYYVKKAIDEGADIKGYNYWSLMDNFEWLYGFKPKFGLVEIDYKTLERKPRKSFWEYKKIIEENSLG